MSVDERKRHQLYNSVVEKLGQEEADILMAHLPPGGYSNLATKQDLLQLKGELKSFMLWTILTVNLVLAGVFAGIAFGAAGLGS